MFVVSIAVQVISALYTDTPRPPISARVGRACADGLRDLTQASETARLDAGRYHGREQAERVFEQGKKNSAWAEYAKIAMACESDPNGADALAAVQRFDRAAQHDAVRQAASLGRVRREVESFIRGLE